MSKFDLNSFLDGVLSGKKELAPTIENVLPERGSSKQVDISNVEVPNSLIESIVGAIVGSDRIDDDAQENSSEVSEMDQIRTEINELRQEVTSLKLQINENCGCGTTVGHLGVGPIAGGNKKSPHVYGKPGVVKLKNKKNRA